MIKHSVLFQFKPNLKSIDKEHFFNAVKKLALIEGVNNLEIMEQFNVNNSFEFSIAMEFNNVMVYTTYNEHPQHKSFIENYWIKMVDNFLEIDLKNTNK